MKKSTKKKIKIYVDTIDATYHIPDDWHGIRIYFSKESIEANNKCWKECGITQLELDISKPKMIVEGDPKLWIKACKSASQVCVDYIFVSRPKQIWMALKDIKWAMFELIKIGYYKAKHKLFK